MHRFWPSCAKQGHEALQLQGQRKAIKYPTPSVRLENFDRDYV